MRKSMKYGKKKMIKLYLVVIETNLKQKRILQLIWENKKD